MIVSFLHLENNWIPLIWIFAMGALLRMMPLKHELVAGIVVKRWYWVNCLLLTMPLIVWSGFRGYVADTTAYITHFLRAPNSLIDLPAYLQTVRKDRGFTVFMVLCKSIGFSSYQSFFTLVACIQILCLIYTFRRYAENFWLCFFLFVASTDYSSWMFNGMRQFIAVCITFAAFNLLVKGNFLRFSLVVVLAAQFHGTALIMIPFGYIMTGPAMNKKTLLLIMATMVIVPFIDLFMPILENLLADTQYGNITSDEIWSSDDGTNVIRVIVYSMPAIIAIVGHKYIRNTSNMSMNLCINASILTMAVYAVSSVTSGIYVGRLPIYTTFHGYMALPWLLDQMLEKQSARLIKFAMIVCYLGFYYYQMFVVW